MMGGERLDISGRNADSTAAPQTGGTRSLIPIVMGVTAVVKRYLQEKRPVRAGIGGPGARGAGPDLAEPTKNPENTGI